MWQQDVSLHFRIKEVVGKLGEPESQNVISESESVIADVKEVVKSTPEPETEVVQNIPMGPEEIYAKVLDGYYADLTDEIMIDDYFPVTEVWPLPKKNCILLKVLL